MQGKAEAKRFLLVEDDKSIVLGLEYSLIQEGYLVTVTGTVAGALSEIKTAAYDFTILDLGLPDGNGYEVCRCIKERQPDMPVIFLTACDEEVNVVMGLDMGADDYITKPFRIRELISRIQSIFRRCSKQENAPYIYRYADIEIQIRQAKVYKKGKEVLLTALEYRLLLTLVQNGGQVVTRNQLLEGIWDIAGEFVNDNTLTVYIKRLREKLEESKDNPVIIQTIRGLGYKIG